MLNDHTGVNYSQFLGLTSPEGQKALIDVIKAFREQYGEKWREEFCEQNPDFNVIAEICFADSTGDEAFKNLRDYVAEQFSPGEIFNKQIALSGLDVFKTQLLQLHAAIRAEVTRPLLKTK
jgi:hypothetical protein